MFEVDVETHELFPLDYCQRRAEHVEIGDLNVACSRRRRPHASLVNGTVESI